MILAGIDIGGTKCAVSLGRAGNGHITLLSKKKFKTLKSPERTVSHLIERLNEMLGDQRISKPDAIGISCGGPLNSEAGLILSPPNLPGWEGVQIVSPFEAEYGVPVRLQNDANACALAEWMWGAGQGLRNVVFLTFGTGMGAGIIINGKLYSGTNDNAGEVGHIRLTEDGPIGHGKPGSFEGYCSGGGIVRLAGKLANEALERGESGSWYRKKEDLPRLTAEIVAAAAREGEPLALKVFRIVGERLGQGAAIIVDLLNPERIVIGSIFARQRELLEPVMLEALRKEALSVSLSACSVVPAGLGEQVGDYAALSVALYAFDQRR
ncbi:ROK family protein [Paenibacillus sp.]|uniref:ROK family protein n=1 Tax=Paenibacillus sp. TaxID=58172 RepID=UPI002D5B4CDC|nr:ROK family protein [Paenibacillus sp.]HZG86326.1 ROK family protein [Paenibacillus sp.]